MAPRTSAYDPGRLEAEVGRFWSARGFPASGGISGPPDGAVLHAFEGALVTREGPAAAAFRAVAADVIARYLALVGRRAVGTLRWEPSESDASEPAEAGLLRKLAVWTGGSAKEPWDSQPRYRGVEAMVGRLARQGSIVSRDLPLRVCPACGVPRAPERIIYQEEEGDAYLVRFEFPHEGRPIAALVWVDAPWKLLGTCGVLIHPFLPYVVARYRRKDASEIVFTSRSSLERFRAWIPDASFEVLEERPGQEFAGAAYQYPLRHEFPMGGSLTPPAGTVFAVSDVTDTGTGIVPLVPGHGSTDAAIAAAHGIPGWPLVTPRGQLDFTLVHKYAGLDLTTANEFIVRDLTEGDSVFAHLTVRRGVPHCLVCGSSLIWVPGRAWCLEPGRLPPESIAMYSRLLPDAPPLPHVEVAPWPVSETSTSEEESAVALLECSQCERLDALEGSPNCKCGGKMYPLRRRLTASVSAAFHAWARTDPFPPADSARLYLAHRRRVPGLIHHLAGMAAVVGPVTNVGVTELPTLPPVDLAALAETHGADAVRAALVRTEATESTAASFAERCRQETRRLQRLFALADEVLEACDASMLSSFAAPISGFLSELEPEDRALLARWERVRVLALADFDRFASAAVHRRVFRFLDTDLAAYRHWVRPRLTVAGNPTTKRAALRTLTYVVRTTAVLLSPILPVLAESIHRRFVSDRTSIPEESMLPANPSLLDDKLVAAWDRWKSVLAALADFRRSNGLPPDVSIPSVALVVPSDDEGDRFRSDRPVLERLAHVGRLEVGSPRESWQGRRRQVRPVESEIQRAYPSQASQIVHLLRRMPPRRSGEGSSAELSVVIQGLPRRVLRSMVEYVDTLPENTVPVPWALGEMYVQRSAAGPRGTLVPPPLSSDAFWLVRHLDRRLRNAGIPPAGSGWKAVVSAVDPLASELRAVAEPLAAYLGLSELRVPEKVEEAVPPNRVRGRTRTGARWWVGVPGLPAPTRRLKRRAARGSGRRVPIAPVAPELATPETDFANEKVIAEEEAVRTLNQELDGLLRVPLLGPAKVRAAWAAGFDSLDDFRGASYEQLAPIPGFGGAVAAALVTALGSKPPSAPRPRPRVPAGTARRPLGPPIVVHPPASVSLAAPPLLPPANALPPSPPTVPSPTALPDREAETNRPPAGSGREGGEIVEAGVLPATRIEPVAAETDEGRPMSNASAPLDQRGSGAGSAISQESAEKATDAPEPGAPPIEDENPPAATAEHSLDAADDLAAMLPEPAPGELSPVAPEGASTVFEPSTVSPRSEPTEEGRLPSVAEPGGVERAEVEMAIEAGEPSLEESASAPALLVPTAPDRLEERDGNAELPPSTTPDAVLPVVPEVAPASDMSSAPPETEGPEPIRGGVEGEVETSVGGDFVTSTAPVPGAAGEGTIPESRRPSEEGTPGDVSSLELSIAPEPPEESVAPAGGMEANEEPSPSGADDDQAHSATLSSGATGSSPPAEEARSPEATGPAPDSHEGSEPAADTELTASPGPPGPEGFSTAHGDVAPTGPARARSGTESDVGPRPSATDEPALTSGLPEAPPPPAPASLLGFPRAAATALLPISAPLEPPPPPRPPPGGIELSIGSQVLASLQPFLEATAAGLPGVCVVRESPERVRAHVGARPIEVYWLSNLGRDRTIRPNDLPGFAAFLEQKLSEAGIAVFFIEGIEYLARIHGVEPVLERLGEFDRQAREHEARVWLHVDPDLLRPGDLDRIQEAFAQKPPRA